jgi:hypothetical protein
MNKIVRNYPASRLPEDLREGVDPNAIVTVTVATADELPSYKPMTLEEILALREPPFRPSDDVVAEIRQLRSERTD